MLGYRFPIRIFDFNEKNEKILNNQEGNFITSIFKISNNLKINKLLNNEINLQLYQNKFNI